jgi:hypothetical protein
MMLRWKDLPTVAHKATKTIPKDALCHLFESDHLLAPDPRISAVLLLRYDTWRDEYGIRRLNSTATSRKCYKRAVVEYRTKEWLS